MKISQEQKEKNRAHIISVAVDLMIRKGIKAATMREIARSAGIGDATIYNYFPTKEHILFAYYEDHVAYCDRQIAQIDGFDDFSFQEKVQCFFETSLDRYLADREFIAQSFKTIFFSMSQNFQQLEPIRQRFVSIVNRLLEAAIQAGEIPPLMFKDLIVQLFWDFYVTMVVYWASDTSEGFSQTTVLLDKSLDLSTSVLKAGLFNKLFDLGTFLFKNHVLNRMHFIASHIDDLDRLKKKFTEADRDNGNSAK